jgi:3,4-dihydroxy 2-butanone 4-phosphate synthase/GTP cyclohydrolase II
LQQIADEGRGVLLYLRTGASGEMALQTLTSYLSRLSKTETATATPSPPAMPMNFREFGIGAQILNHLGLRQIRVMTNHPQPFHGLAGFGLEIVDWVPLSSKSTA